jgi:diguanylate cyclase (GGDEF)-like protein/PAS domain S-box-containing protein
MDTRRRAPWGSGWSGWIWWNGIVFRSLAAVTLITALLGGLSGVVIHEQITARVDQEARQHLGELLDTVESTASVACFANDEQLAREVVQGLLRNGEVRRVSLSSGDTELAHAERPTEVAGTPESQPHAPSPVKRALMSPFKKGQIIGEIRLEANWEAIFSRMDANVRYAMLILTGLLLLVIIGTAGMVYLVVVRPIKATSDRLHRLDATGGASLKIPDGHQHTEIGRLVGDINDLTERLVSTLEQERELRRQQKIAERMYQDLFDHAASGIFVADSESRLVSFNPAFVELTRLPPVPLQQARHLAEPNWDDAEQVLNLLRRSALEHRSCADDFLLRGGGNKRWLHVVILPLGDGSMQGTVTDVTARKREEILARRQAITDALTGFANRAGLLQHFAHLDRASDPAFTTVMINLNGFKQINDALGLPVGDYVLRKVAKRIRDAGRPGDFLCRIGGDEFIFVLAGLSDHDALASRIEALHARLCEPYVLDRGPVSISSRLGIAVFPQDGSDMPQLLRSAELALNSVREANRGAGAQAYAFFAPQLQAAVEHRRRLEDDLRLAVSGGELRLVFQPIIDLRANRLAGAEALLRWQHAERGFVSPEVFIPLAERIGLIGEIGRTVLDEACRQVADWRRAGHDLYVSVNVSGRQIPDELPPEAVFEALQRHKLPPSAIALEITEGVLMGDVDVAQSWIEPLRAAGLRIYLDDFGTGYSSLSYLKRFPMDTVKIDKSFIVDMNADNSDRTLVNAIITMAASLGLDVVAEGIEEASQLALLRDMGCGYGQGYFFSRPVPAADFVATAQRINAELAKRNM